MENNKKFWQRVAKFYSFFMRKNKKIYISLSDILDSYLTKNMTVLEIGCGTGQLSFLVGEKVKKLIATDFSDKMIEICKKKNTKDILFQVEDGTALSFKENSFEAVLIANVLHIVPNSDKLIEEIKRVIKDNGIIFTSIYVNDSQEFNFKLWFLQKIGFKLYKKNKSKDYVDYLKSQNLKIILVEIIEGKPFDECVVVAEKSKN